MIEKVDGGGDDLWPKDVGKPCLCFESSCSLNKDISCTLGFTVKRLGVRWRALDVIALGGEILLEVGALLDGRFAVGTDDGNFTVPASSDEGEYVEDCLRNRRFGVSRLNKTIGRVLAVNVDVILREIECLMHGDDVEVNALERLIAPHI